MRIKQLGEVANARVFLVGIKGVGMSALAEAFHARGATIEGSDSSETFYTDALLRELNIPVHSLDDLQSIDKEYDFVVHSAAYDPDTQPQLQRFQARNTPLLTYPQVLGALSADTFAVAIAGVHGKTTISGMSATIAKELELDGVCVTGGQIDSLGGRSTYISGDRFLLAETCEYRRHFLYFHPDILAISNIELDHQDYFKDEEDMFSAFRELAQRLAHNGVLIYCCDDEATSRLAQEVFISRNDIQLVPYGQSAQESGGVRIMNKQARKSGMRFSINQWHDIDFEIPLFGAHIVANATAALAIIDTLQQRLYQQTLDGAGAAAALKRYRGAKRRMETVGGVGGITILDDYAHHPTAIEATLGALRQSDKYRRIIVDFMPHTYSRTLALLDRFGSAFADADIVICHQIYASAREEHQQGITGKRLAAEVRKHHQRVRYFARPADARRFCLNTLASGDAFITLGAGDNWKLGHSLYKKLTEQHRSNQ